MTTNGKVAARSPAKKPERPVGPSIKIGIRDIVRMRVAEIVPSPHNPRRLLKPGDPAYDLLKRNMEEFGMVEALVWNKRTKRLVGGHQRLAILKEGGVKEAFVGVVDEPEDREWALCVALNNPKLQGEFVFTSLADGMAHFDTGALDMTLTGFGQAELESMALYVGDGRKAGSLPPVGDMPPAPAAVPENGPAGAKHVCPKCGFEFQEQETLRR
jgi:hypothetical protein